jgi:hypothetical protein
MKKNASIAAAAAAITLSLVACAASDGAATGDDANVTEGTTPAPKPVDRPADVQIVQLTKNVPNCHVSVQLPKIDAHDAAANAAIAKTIPIPTADSFCMSPALGSGADALVGGTFGVLANEHGILTVTTSREDQNLRTNEGQKFATLSVFERKTGKLLKVNDVLDPAGIDVARKACADGLVNDFAFDRDQAERECELSFDTSEAMPPLFTVEPRGFRVQFAILETFEKTKGILVPWASLAAHVTPVLAEYVAAHR